MGIITRRQAKAMVSYGSGFTFWYSNVFIKVFVHQKCVPSGGNPILYLGKSSTHCRIKAANATFMDIQQFKELNLRLFGL